MAYTKQYLIDKCVKILEEDSNTAFVGDLIIQLPISKQTFYNHELDKVDSIKEGLAKNKTALKKLMRAKWLVSDNATLQVALYKLLADEDEYAKLATIKQDVNLEPTKIIFENTSIKYTIDENGNPVER